jgi:hypothetical protein
MSGELLDYRGQIANVEILRAEVATLQRLRQIQSGEVFDIP